jgi:signal transduction histidine kinase
MGSLPKHTDGFSLHLPILDILDEGGICFSIKKSDLNFVYQSGSFIKLLEQTKDFFNDFDLFIPEVAYEITQEDGRILTSGVTDEVDRILITKDQKQLVVKLRRSVVDHGGEKLLLTTYTDITAQSQNKHFDAYKQVLTDGEIFEKMLNRFSQLIFSGESKKEVFLGVGKLCLDILDLEDLSIFLVDQDKHLLYQSVIVSRGKPIRYDETGEKYIKVPLYDGITGKCVKTKSTILLDDVSLDKDYITDTIDCKSELAVPIIYNNTVLGVIDSESTSYSGYTDKAKRTLEGIASLLAIKLHELISKQELEAKNELLLSLVKNNPNAQAMLDLKGNYIQVSDVWMNQFVVHTSDSIIGLNHYTLNPNLPIRWKKMISRANQGKSQVLQKEGYKRKNGNVEFFKGQVNPWFLKGGEVGGVIIQADIITQTVNDEIKLHRNTKELAEARLYGQLYSWEVDLEKGTMHVDTGKLEIPGVVNGEHYSLDTFFQYIDPDYFPDFNKALQSAISSEGTFALIHPIKIGKNEFWMHNRGKVVSEGGVVKYLIGTAQNITNQIDAQNAYKQKNAELKQINNELDQFVYKTAHDLRAPLANITGLIGLMRMETNPKILSTYFDLQEKSISRLDTFIQKITNYTKNTRLPIHNEKINFNLIVDNVLREHMFITGSEDVKKKLTVDNSQKYYSDSERITIILNNLISNAIQFRDSNKDSNDLDIAISLEGKFIHICVRDNGVGIPEDYKQKVFDMFFRGHKSADGSGIGLYIVKETVNKLGGSILLNTEEGVYSEFNILIPNIKV